MLGENEGGKELNLFQLATAGGVAGGIVSFVLNPFEVIKVQMQVMNSTANSANNTATAVRKYSGVMDCVLQTIKNEGIVKGLYRGQTSLLLREMPGNFCWYGGERCAVLSPGDCSTIPHTHSPIDNQHSL